MVSSFDLLTILIGSVISVLVLAYTAYWTFRIRRALAVKLYRNQALGIGLVATSWAFVQVLGGFANAQLLSRTIIIFFLWFASLTLFYWVDASVLSARRSDPLLRDTIHWRQLRISLWALEIIPIPVVVSVILYNLIVTGSFSPSPSPTAFFFVFTPLFVPVISGAIVLPIGAVRSKDMTLRNHLRWFGLFSAFLIVSLVFNNPLLYILTVFYASFFAGSYCLYRSAKSLVPLSRLPPVETRV